MSRSQFGSSATVATPEGPYKVAKVDKAGLADPISQSRSRMGFPGLVQAIVMEPVFVDPNDPRNRSGPIGQPGKYEVTFVLQRPGYPLTPETRVSFAQGLTGDSHIAISKPAVADPTWTGTRMRINSRVDGEDFLFEGTPNDSGFLAKLVTICDAATFLDAHRKASRALQPAISNWSLTLDIPVAIYQTDVKQISTAESHDFHTTVPGCVICTDSERRTSSRTDGVRKCLP